jgi:ribosome-associated toxin RatA of RatAB toxin-antitoxin module
VLVPYSVESVFDVIEQAERYPEFLPWCVGATILERSDDWVAAKVDFSYRRGRFSLRTRHPQRRSGMVARAARRRPIPRFDGDWRLTPLGDLGCKIEFDVSYEISDGLLDQLARPAVDIVSRSIMDAFVKRVANLSSEAP